MKKSLISAATSVFFISFFSLGAQASEAELAIVNWLTPLFNVSFSFKQGGPNCQNISIANFGGQGRLASINLTTPGGGDTIYEAGADKNCSIDSTDATLTCNFTLGSGSVFSGNDGHYKIQMTKNNGGGLASLSFQRVRKSSQENTSISCQN